MRRTIIFSLLTLASCAPDKLVYYQPKIDTQAVSTKQNLAEVLGTTGRIDMLWVIDNSYSMDTWQKSVIANSEVFMESLIQQKIKWKMGLISTDENNEPFIGLKPGTELDFNSRTPVDDFKKSVSDLGLNGSGTEKFFTPLLKQLTDYPGFLRADTPLAIIVVTDAPEQSRLDFADFYQKYQFLMGNRDVYMYGVFGAQDPSINCKMTDDPFTYAGSPYELLFDSAQYSKVYPLCSPDFGKNLAKIGEDIAARARMAKIYLESRPKMSTLKLMNGAKELARDDVAHPGVWFYDYTLNAVCIHNTDSIDSSAELKVVYEKDDGYGN